MDEKNKTGKHKLSSGTRWLKELGRQAKYLRMKIARWERNKSNSDKDSVWPTPFCNRDKQWDTTGLEKHLAFVIELQKSGVATKHI